MVDLVRLWDSTRLVDTDSGGPANDLHIGDVNDIHDYPDPKDPLPSDTQYAMIGEFGGIGQCFQHPLCAYLPAYMALAKLS